MKQKRKESNFIQTNNHCLSGRCHDPLVSRIYYIRTNKKYIKNDLYNELA